MSEETIQFIVEGGGPEVLQLIMTKDQAWSILSSLLIGLKAETEPIVVEVSGMEVDIDNPYRIEDGS